MTAEEFFFKTYGNKINANESWMINFAEKYHQAKLDLLGRGVGMEVDTFDINELVGQKLIDINVDDFESEIHFIFESGKQIEVSHNEGENKILIQVD
jgi:hypothetical protein